MPEFRSLILSCKLQGNCFGEGKLAVLNRTGYYAAKVWLIRLQPRREGGLSCAFRTRPSRSTGQVKLAGWWSGLWSTINSPTSLLDDRLSAYEFESQHEHQLIPA
ncbi:uncharacterized protein CLUP02_17071 [Colletotrichum lupini]|uniref:Uncharacterized protein n=1 Tax=Colletotrichum lupini TaxID=145971 RepID=A0A9Q8WQS6_9PEZI|nr:uncharacterized protein CLUP02_17071 [Colletotrichum lupini]UQC91535.1 hypothetical protein CLUP02_17071 [Colletotrichum lupini]